jgi:hypothetical protein
MAWRSEQYLAALLDLEKKTLQGWRRRKDRGDTKRQSGPEFIRLSHRCVRYSDEAIDKWLAEQPRTPLRRRRGGPGPGGPKRRAKR